MIEDWSTQPGETPIDPSGLRSPYKKWVKTRRQLAQPEAENIRKATLKYLTGKLTCRKAPFDVAWMLRLHHEMLGDVWQWAGQTRRTGCQFGVDWQQIEMQLYGTVEDLEIWQESMDLLEQSTNLHFRGVWIHPFQDGNGRWARLLANIWLRLNGEPIVEWPAEVSGIESRIRQEYLDCIRHAIDGEMGPLIKMHKKFCR
jgi:fido (protein-threonine AMPylation protein)